MFFILFLCTFIVVSCILFNFTSQYLSLLYFKESFINFNQYIIAYLIFSVHRPINLKLLSFRNGVIPIMPLTDVTLIFHENKENIKSWTGSRTCTRIAIILRRYNGPLFLSHTNSSLSSSSPRWEIVDGNTRLSMTVMHGIVEFIPERNAAKVILSARHIGAWLGRDV